MQHGQFVQDIGKPLAFLLPRHIEPHRVVERFASHRHLRCQWFFAQVHKGAAQSERL